MQNGVRLTREPGILVSVMLNKNKKIQLDKILNHPGLKYKKITRYKYLIEYNGRQWYLWPNSGRFQNLRPEGSASEMFVGELKDFYHRYLTQELKLPENFGKSWTKSDEDALYEMVEYGSTLRQISDELQRHPVSVAVKLSKYIGDQNMLNQLSDEVYDVAVTELLSWRS